MYLTTTLYILQKVCLHRISVNIGQIGNILFYSLILILAPILILLELNAFAMFYEMWLTKFYDDDIQHRQDVVNLYNSTHKSKLYN